MKIILAYYLFFLAAAVILPTLPSSRRVRIVLAIVSLLAIVYGYDYADRASSRVGASYMDYYVSESSRLLKEGKIDVLRAAYGDYTTNRGPTLPATASAAHRAYLLQLYIRQHERELADKW